MFCNKCGAKLPDNSSFCGECGAPVRNTEQNVQQVPVQMHQQTPTQTAPKNNKPLIIGLSVAIAVLLIFLILLIVKIVSDNGSEKIPNPEVEPNTIVDEVFEEGDATEETRTEATSETAQVQTENSVTAVPATEETEKPSKTADATSVANNLVIADEYEDPDYYDSPYYDPQYGPAYGIVVSENNGDTVTFSVYYIGRNASPFYETDEITVTLDKNHSASFNWDDSWGNSGTGKITFSMTEHSEPCATLIMEQTVTSDFNRYSLGTNGKTLYATESYAP